MEMKGRDAYFTLCPSRARSAGIGSTDPLSARGLPAGTSHRPGPGSVAPRLHAGASKATCSRDTRPGAVLPAAGTPAGGDGGERWDPPRHAPRVRAAS